MFLIQKENKYLSKDGRWVSLLEIDKIRFFDVYVTAAQICNDAKVVTAKDVIESLVLGDPDNHYARKIIDEHVEINREACAVIEDLRKQLKQTESDLLNCKTSNLDLRTKLNEIQSESNSGWMSGVGRQPDESSGG